MPTFQFAQVNVFSADPLGGNPLAVVHAAEGPSEAQMAARAVGSWHPRKRALLEERFRADSWDMTRPRTQTHPIR